ncbi:MAG: nitroreductase family protein [Desulfomicrobium sp.]|nr:nitroreductase family protein [Desulfomicrobium sp.]
MKYPGAYTPDLSQRDPHSLLDELFVQRWSPRSFVKTNISPEDLASVLDAARWAPSAYNEQPWRILTSTSETFATFLELLAEPNQKWAHNASVIGFMIAKKNFTFNAKPNPWAIFDCGSAWMSLTLQARKLGLYTHGMAGIKKEAIHDAFHIDRQEFEVVAGFVIGLLDEREHLEKPYVDWESPSPRKALPEIWKQGVWTE